MTDKELLRALECHLNHEVTLLMALFNRAYERKEASGWGICRADRPWCDRCCKACGKEKKGMTDKELLGALNRLGKDVVDTPICAGCRYKDNCEEQDCAIIRAAVERVADTGWKDASVEVPDHDEMVLVTVNGQHGHIKFKEATELAHYYEGEGWVLENYPEWVAPGVTHWWELPEGPDATP